MKLRMLGAAAVALLAAGTLSACRTNVGNAATVNGHQISESEVSSYLEPTGADPSLVAQAKAAGQSVPAARAIILRTKIDNLVYERALDRNGGVPNNGKLTALRGDAIAVLAGGNGQTVRDSDLADQLEQAGVRSEFVSVYLRGIELEYALISRLKLTMRTELTAVVKKAGVTVSVSPRYGSWDNATESLNSDSGAGLPGFLTLRPTAGSSASPSVTPPQ